MSTIEAIQTRKSVRTYSDEPVGADTIARINQYIKTLEAPFGVKADIRLISVKGSGKGQKLGTYGVVKGARNFLVLMYEDGPMAEYAAGYVFEQAILYCTSLGLSTCWIGATFNHKDFAEQIWLSSNEQIRIISPLGYARPKKPLRETIIRGFAKSDQRRPFGSIFFLNDFRTPLPESEAWKYLKPLQMLRLAPSSTNSQPWRVVKEYDHFHFYCIPSSRFSKVDMGIALCHFEQTCIEIGIPGHYTVLPEIQSKAAPKGCRYTISWEAKPLY